MKAYGITRWLLWYLEYWAGSPSRSGNKTKSKIKKPARRVYKKIARAKLKEELRNEEKDYYGHGFYCECNQCKPKNLNDL